MIRSNTMDHVWRIIPIMYVVEQGAPVLASWEGCTVGMLLAARGMAVGTRRLISLRRYNQDYT